MEIIKNILDLNKAINGINNLGFVPTMGGLHDGHISLIKNSQKKCKKTIVSIFVNPAQFNNKDDFKKYPRNLNRDINILKKLEVNFLFLPKFEEIYQKKRNKKIKLNKNDKILCAFYRKGHFEGVLDIMDRLLSIIKAKYVFMGEKDYQQLFLIKKRFKNKYSIKIIGCPTIRERNKLALSSRNFLLSNNNYFKAGLIAKYLLKFKYLYKGNYKRNHIILNKTIKELENKYKIKIEYLEFRNLKDLKLADFKKKFRLFLAYYINNVRLIDNF